MIRSLIKLGLLLVVGILVYNYFWGTAEEKASSQEIFNEVKDLGKATWNLLKSEKEKFDQGKYDEALTKVEGVFDSLRSRAEAIQDSDMVDRVNELDKDRQSIQQQLKDAENTGGLSPEEQEKLKNDWKKLMSETEKIMNELDKN